MNRKQQKNFDASKGLFGSSIDSGEINRSKGGRQSWRPAPVQGLAMAEGQDLSDIQGGLAKASGPRVIVLQVDKKLLIKTDS